MSYLVLILFFSFCLPSYYSVGDTVSLEDQNLEFSICYGEYPNDVFKFSDNNWELNGGNEKITVLRINASW